MGLSQDVFPNPKSHSQKQRHDRDMDYRPLPAHPVPETLLDSIQPGIQPREETRGRTRLSWTQGMTGQGEECWKGNLQALDIRQDTGLDTWLDRGLEKRLNWGLDKRLDTGLDQRWNTWLNKGQDTYMNM